jgi:glycosyltransferase involved in cell wall biosynthesis
MVQDSRQLAEQKARPSIVFWKLATIDTTIASARYRVGLPAMFLEDRGVGSRLFEYADVPPLQTRPVALIFSKSFTVGDIPLATRAVELHVPVILDLCDNIFVEGYRRDRADPTVFATLAKFATAIVVTSPALVEVIRKTVTDLPPIYQIPDGAETRLLSHRIERWMLTHGARDIFRHSVCLVRGNGDVSTRGCLAVGRLVRAVVISITLGWRVLLSGMLQLFPKSPGISVAQASRAIELFPRFVYQRARSWRKSFHRVPNRVRYWQTSWPQRVQHWRTSWQQNGIQWLSSAVIRKGRQNKRDRPASFADDNRKKLGEARAPYPLRMGCPQGKLDSSPTRRTLIWFGNYGASYSKFGMGELVALKSALVEVSCRWEIELLVVSNNYGQYQKLIRPLPLNTRYIEWSLDTVYFCLSLSDVALVPNALDAFSVCKSANRTILALSAGVPVVATRTPALQPFESCVIFDDWVRGIEAYLVDHELVARHLKNAGAIIGEEYSGPRIADLWQAVINAANEAAPGHRKSG